MNIKGLFIDLFFGKRCPKCGAKMHLRHEMSMNSESYEIYECPKCHGMLHSPKTTFKEKLFDKKNGLITTDLDEE